MGCVVTMLHEQVYHAVEMRDVGRVIIFAILAAMNRALW